MIYLDFLMAAQKARKSILAADKDAATVVCKMNRTTYEDIKADFIANHDGAGKNLETTAGMWMIDEPSIPDGHVEFISDTELAKDDMRLDYDIS